MVKAPFKKAPRLRVLLKMVPPSLAVGALGILLVGYMAGSEGFKPESPFPAETSPQLHHRAIAYYRDVYHELTHIPVGCTGDAASEFRAEKCSKWWTKVATECSLALAPLLIAWIFLVLAMDSGGAVYRRIRKRIASTPYVLKGRVTNPARVRNDFYGWLYCFQSIAVELPDHSQVRVYFAPDATLPLPGETVAVFKLGRAMGAQRFVGTIYAPHVAVIAATGT